MHGCEAPQPVSRSRLAVGEVAQCHGVEPAQERASDAPAETVIHPFLVFLGTSAGWQPMDHSHLYWPGLDVDLAIESIEFPDRFPLVSS